MVPLYFEQRHMVPPAVTAIVYERQHVAYVSYHLPSDITAQRRFSAYAAAPLPPKTLMFERRRAAMTCRRHCRVNIATRGAAEA